VTRSAGAALALALLAAVVTPRRAAAQVAPPVARTPALPFQPPTVPLAGTAPPRAFPVPVQGARAVPPPRYVIEVLTFGPGDHPFTRFGHDAIRVLDRLAQTDVVYNFGTFSITPGLISDFLRGRLRYWLSVSSTGPALEEYRLENRSIEAQGLALSAGAAAELVRRLQENALPQNRAYKYDYFRDNCATRVRDALDGVTGGAVRAAAATPAAQTLRGQALRMAADDLPFYLALSIVLGPAADRPIDAWSEDFLPQMLQRTLRVTRLSDPPARALVANERVVFAAHRPLPRPAPPRWAGRFLAAGMAAGLMFFLLGALARRLVLARVLLGALLAITGGALGFLGSFLLGAWLFTPHAVVYRNQNVLLCAPFALALAVLGWGVAFGWAGAIRKAFFVTAAALGLAALAALIKPLAARQDNGALIAFALPLWLGLTGALAKLRTRAAPST